MSRENDSSSAGPQGRGGAAYPSGTPPYGSPAQGAAEGGADRGRRQAADERPEEPETQTTLTTRIRINIPGSRPIPPVVVRTPVGDEGPRGDASDDGGRRDGAAPGAPGAPDAGRPSSATDGPQGSGSASGSGGPGPAAGEGGPGPSGAAPGGEKTSDWFAPRKPARGEGGAPGPAGGQANSGPQTPASGAPGGSGASRGPGAPQGGPSGSAGPANPGRNGSGTGSFDVSGAVASGPLGTGGPQGGDSTRGDLPYFSGGPAGPTGGPVTGDGPMAPPPGSGRPAPSGGPGNPAGVPPRSGAMSDDTAILTPQKSGPVAPPPGGNVSGETLTSGIPVVPPVQGDSPFPQGPGADGAMAHTPPKLPEPVRPDVPAAPAAKKKKGRNKLVLLAVAVVVVACGAYGAGLLMNHADVPKGTTVLGVDIGGGTRDEAVKKLDAAIGERVAKPLKLSVDGEEVTLKPDQAGLTLDSQATVRAAASSDYNPVSVVGSLIGGERVVEPVMPVDKEKLAAALERAAGGSGSAKEGTVEFLPGKAVPVYGKAGKGIDAQASTKAVSDAYKKQVETGSAGTVRVPVTTRKPTVSKAEVDKFMTRFAQPAMSANVTIKAGDKSIPFGPAKSLPKILETKVLKDGTLQEHYKLPELEKLYGNVFDGVLIQRGNGDKTPVQPTDVAQAMGKALMGKTPAERIGVIETNGS
ncbi:Peptidoglycan binding domain-containing protein OS=Streptomyces alboniger OX=132473 GN=CP975_23235 PE=4 SV=1 [Streptomyces alboniger]